MKKIFNLLFLGLYICVLAPTAFSCTDVSGNGMDSITWQGSSVAQETKYHNPIWEPDLEYGTVFKTSTSYIAMAGETQWVSGLTYNVSVISSTNLMDWTFNSLEAFDSIPTWTSGRLHDITVAWAKTIPSTSYWAFYQMGDGQNIGSAYATTAAGPYTDCGEFINASALGCTTLKHPFFIVNGTTFYLFYTTENGTYCQQLTLKKASAPTLKGSPVLVAGSDFGDVACYRESSSSYYLFGTVKNDSNTEIHYARCSTINGIYTGKDGTGLLSGQGTGTTLVIGNSTFINPENLCGAFPNSNGLIFVAFNATQADKPTMNSGYNRRPLFLYSVARNDNGWFTSTITPEKGWTTPRFD